MPTQSTHPSIPLFHTPSEAGYKLLELPAELVDLLESSDPPALTLHATPTAAVLKTPVGKTYSLRQKNTSNALILLQTTDKTAPNAGLDAIATVHETVELVPEEGEAPAPRARGKWHEKFGRGR
ncbi:hypothetical protein QBC34DRAFT_407999 [Podospora aff. communis PSN243]|uniref:Sister chromatid cohesion protein DCC1 n=1 Tax=Podospora aff. communis PSN243 TaxID=3040156 RepID=A0AAV9GMZ2_9PEZI|nr:hypothetical protein QBC34DRAFT_407999 [Podospora aff. communis PSN243]